MARIFVNYRREDSHEVTKRIYDELAGEFGEEAIFRDVDTIPFGADFAYFIQSYIQYSSVVLVIIGEQWLSLKESWRRRRIDAPGDFVRQEIEAALENDIRIIPILIDSASMPSHRALPKSIRVIASINAAQVRTDSNFSDDVEKLIPELRQIMAFTKPPKGPVRTVGIVEGFSFEPEGWGQSRTYTRFTIVGFLNPMTNQQDTAKVVDNKKYKVGDLIKIRRNALLFRWWRAWLLDE